MLDPDDALELRASFSVAGEAPTPIKWIEESPSVMELQSMQSTATLPVLEHNLETLLDSVQV